jgi:undecaprenyl diphosphate synthase
LTSEARKATLQRYTIATIHLFYRTFRWEQTLDPRDADIQRTLKEQGNLPRHIAIIMDGNGRWAQQRSLPRSRGHRSAREVVRDIVRACGELRIDVLTLFTFGTDNWNRPWSEVLSLMQLLRDASSDELPELCENNVRLVATGDTDRLAKQARRALMFAISQTAEHTGLTLNLALSYDGRSDILQAVRKVASEVEQGRLSADQIDSELFSRSLYTDDLPDPDLLVRTSGEMRLSNFMLWQCAYTELWFTPVLWPDFRREHLYEAIRSYQSRERRFGHTSAQVRTSDEARPVREAVSGSEMPTGS